MYIETELHVQCTYLKNTEFYDLSFQYLDKLFASGSLDGTILLWSSETFIPVKKLNTMADYKGKANIYPYSVQYIACENQVLKYYQATKLDTKHEEPCPFQRGDNTEIAKIH